MTFWPCSGWKRSSRSAAVRSWLGRTQLLEKTHGSPDSSRIGTPRKYEIASSEGDARNALAKIEEGNPRRESWELVLEEAIAAQAELLELRPSVPKKAALDDTDLKDKLVWHETEYKMTVDTIRIACANVEADLAFELAPWLLRPREAKKVLANIFAAPGRVRVGDRTITVDLQPAGTTSELGSIRNWLDELNARNLTLPGDPQRRPTTSPSQAEASARTLPKH